MNSMIDSLKRLFKDKNITKQHLDKMLREKKITSQEYNYIISGGD